MRKERKKGLLFAGTTEGRLLAERFYQAQIPCTVCVATDYGAQLFADGPLWDSVQTGRLDARQMEALIRKEQAAVVLDATHPFAVEASQNIRSACQAAACPYLRVLRDQTGQETDGSGSGSYCFADASAAAAFLEHQCGNLFLATGSKELRTMAEQISDLSRIYVRILPSVENLRLCASIGLKGKQIICMQGPFSVSLNKAMLKHCQARWMVTKDSGAAGGFLEKCRAAEQAGAACVVIQRPYETQGYPVDEAWDRAMAYLQKEKGQENASRTKQ